MKKQLLIVGIIVLLVAVGLSGCNEINIGGEKSTALSDGTKVTGDIDQLQILSFEKIKYKEIKCTWETVRFPQRITYTYKIPDYLNFDDINSNLTTRKNFCETYLYSNIVGLCTNIIWYDNYLGWTFHTIYEDNQNNIIEFSQDGKITEYYVNGTVKNIGENFLDYPRVTINYYDANGAWLASEQCSLSNMPSGYSRSFSAKYTDEFVNDVNYISFNVKGGFT